MNYRTLSSRVKARRQVTVMIGALVAPFVVALVLSNFRHSFPNAAASLVMVGVIEAVAILGNRGSGTIASLSAALWFDFFLTVPYDHLAISHRADIETTITILVVGIVLSELAARSRHHYRVEREESTYVALVRDLSTDAAGVTPVDQVVERACVVISTLLNLRSCRFESAPLTDELARVTPSGSVVHVGLHWPVDDIGIPGPQAEIISRWRGVVEGRFVMVPTPGQPVSLERRVVATLVADVVGATLHGSRFEG